MSGNAFNLAKFLNSPDHIFTLVGLKKKMLQPTFFLIIAIGLETKFEKVN